MAPRTTLAPRWTIKQPVAVAVRSIRTVAFARNVTLPSSSLSSSPLLPARLKLQFQKRINFAASIVRSRVLYASRNFSSPALPSLGTSKSPGDKAGIWRSFVDELCSNSTTPVMRSTNRNIVVYFRRRDNGAIITDISKSKIFLEIICC